MKEPNIEGVANHGVPASGGGARESAVEAKDRGMCGPGIEPRNPFFRGADVLNPGGRQHARRRHRETTRGPARSETPCTHRSSLRENRESSLFSAAMVRRNASGRP